MGGRRNKLQFWCHRKKYNLRNQPFFQADDQEADEPRCPICLENIHQPVVTSCNHTFCRYCLIRWLVRNSSCPSCRFLLPSLQTFNGRRNSFNDWPCEQDKNDMADNGFFFILGPSITQCVYCDLVVLSWNPDDDPWSIHERDRPFCPRIFLKKRLENHTRQRYSDEF